MYKAKSALNRENNMKSASRFFSILLPSLVLVVIGSAADARDYYNDALVALKSGDNRNAVTYLSIAINAEPANFQYYNDRGVAYKRMGKLEEAVSDYTKSLQINPGFVNALNNRGVVYTEQGKFDKAVADFSEALKYGNLNGKVHSNLGIALARKGNHAEAVNQFNKSIAVHPSDSRTLLLLSESMERMGEIDKALKTCRDAISLGLDPLTAARVEKKINDLESIKQSSADAAAVSRAPKKRTVESTVPVPETQTRLILPAGANKIESKPETKPEIAPTKDTESLSLSEIETRSRKRAQDSFLPSSVEIFQQGLQFMEQSEARKALVRFEDILQLEKRQKNVAGSTWCLVEIGRVYSKLGDNAKALGLFEEAARTFRKLKSPEELAVTISDLATVKKNMGRADDAAALYASAVQENASHGNYKIASLLSDLAAGRTSARPSPPKVKEQPPVAVPPPAAVKEIAAKPAQPAPNWKTAWGKELKKEAIQRPKAVESSPTDPPRVVPKQAVAPEPEKPVTQSFQDTAVKRFADGPNYDRLQGVGSSPSAKLKDDRAYAANTDAKEYPKIEMRLHLQPVPSDQETKPQAQPKLPEQSAPPKQTAPAKNEKPAKELLADLKKYKETNDLNGMITVLDRLADLYIKAGENEKALHGLTASIAYRDKIGSKNGLDEALQKSGRLKEKVGNLSGAMEDFTRGLILASNSPDAKTRATYEDKLRKIGGALGFHTEELVNAYKQLWKSRSPMDNQRQTEALYLIGKLYEKIQRNTEALEYYERVSASLLTDKAKIYEKIGRTHLAGQAYEQALEIFQRLDYSRYQELLREVGSSSRVTRQ